MARTFTEGSKAVAETVKLCRPNVIAAYPITPQTHISEELAQMVANGELKAEYVTVESEFAAASGAISLEGIRSALEHRFTKELAEKNLKAATKGYNFVKEKKQ